MENVRVAFTISTELGAASFNGLDDLQPEIQNDLLSWAQFVIQTAAQSLLSQHIGPENAAKLNFSISCNL